MTTYELFRGNTLLGTIDHKEDDFPWHLGRFTAAAGVDDVLALFAAEARLLDDGRSDSDEWRAIRTELDAPGIRLRATETGREVRRAFVHIRGDQVAWR